MSLVIKADFLANLKLSSYHSTDLRYSYLRKQRGNQYTNYGSFAKQLLGIIRLHLMQRVLLAGSIKLLAA